MDVLSINSALSQLGPLANSYVYVSGLLNFEFENISIAHWPKSEWHSDPDRSSIWIEEGLGSLTFNEKTLKKWSGKRVIIGGTLCVPESTISSGHMNLFDASLQATQIHLYKLWPL